ncbi:MAG: SDR family oxidoreductase [Planctomycetota bacterium]|nr:MAG: SDR family oxidoreductase [Planctomycetota bacterium]
MGREMAERIMLITGAGSGIGAAIARHFAAPGTVIYGCGRRLEPLTQQAEELRGFGCEAHPRACDMTDSAAVDELVAEIVARHGRLDVLVANAGIAVNRPFVDTDDGLLEEIMRVNVLGTFACCRAAFRHMRLAEAGTIITIGSVVSHRGYPNQAAYTASKHAIAGFTKSLCAEAQPFGVRVACIMPGGVATDMVRATRPDLDDEAMIQPEDVAEATRYLVDLPRRIAIDSIAMRRWAAAP